MQSPASGRSHAGTGNDPLSTWHVRDYFLEIFLREFDFLNYFSNLYLLKKLLSLGRVGRARPLAHRARPGLSRLTSWFRTCKNLLKIFRCIYIFFIWIYYVSATQLYSMYLVCVDLKKVIVSNELPNGPWNPNPTQVLRFFFDN